nr:hypothetical protein [Sedimentibacter sp.]
MKLYKKEYILEDGQKLTVRTPEAGDAQGLINQMKSVGTYADEYYMCLFLIDVKS